MLTYTWRPATHADYDFLYRLIVVCMKEYVAATWGWDDAFQGAHFARNFDPTDSQILVVDGQDAGQLTLRDEGDEIFLAQIYILPEYQRKGLGTAVIQEVIETARASGRPVRLQVLKVNPARRLYERLGFQVVDVTESYYIMRTTGQD